MWDPLLIRDRKTLPILKQSLLAEALILHRKEESVYFICYYYSFALNLFA